MEKGLLIFKRFLTKYDYNNISQPMNNINQEGLKN
jgi:hypothetical protein